MGKQGTDASSRSFWKKRAIFLGKILVSVLALYLVYRKVDTDAIASLLRQGNWWWILPAMITFVGSQVLSAIRLNTLFRSIGLTLAETVNLRLYWLGMYYNLLLPGGIGGDAYKVVVLRKARKVRTRDLVLTTLADRGFGLIALVSMGLLLLVLLDLGHPMTRWAFALVPVILWVSWLVIGWIQVRWKPIFWKALGISMLVQICQLLSIMSLLHLVGQPFPWTGYLILFLGSSILAALPLSYGGAGAREIAFLYGADWLQLNQASAISISILFYLITLIVSLSGMYFSFRAWHGMEEGYVGSVNETAPES